MLELVRVSRSAELAHRRFADYHWRTGLWPETPPADALALGRIPPAEWRAVVRELRRLGWRSRGRALVCPAVAAIRSHAVRACVVARTTGSKGGSSSWDRRQAAQATLQGTLQGPLKGSLQEIKIKNKKKDRRVPDVL